MDLSSALEIGRGSMRGLGLSCKVLVVAGSWRMSAVVEEDVVVESNFRKKGEQVRSENGRVSL